MSEEIVSYSNLRSKLNRAIVAYLVSTGTCGSADDISPSNSNSPKGYPNTTVRATISRPEVQLTGLRRVSVHISIKGSAATRNPNQPNKEDGARVEFDKRVAATYDAMMQTDDGETLRATAEAITGAGRALVTVADATNADSVLLAANNADMAEFTCQAVYDMGEGDGTADAEGCSWEEILMFDVLCSPSNVD